MKPFLSVIIAGQGSEDLLIELLRADKELSSSEYSYEIIFVSAEESFGVGKKIREGIKNLRHIQGERGRLVQKGILEARGRWRLLLDLDVPVSVSYFRKAIPFLKNGCDIIVGSQKSGQANIIKRILDQVVRNLLGSDTLNPYSPFLCFSEDVVPSIFKQAISQDSLIRMESILLARKLDLKIGEISMRTSKDIRYRKLLSDAIKLRFQKKSVTLE